MGVSVIVAEPTAWLGGMITAAGVSAFDGNKGTLATGFYRAIRDRLEEHYGGKDELYTGWISETCFEPSVGARIIGDLVRESGATVWHGAELVRVLREGDRIAGAVILHQGTEKTVRAKVTIEATEYGDVLEDAGVPYRFGRESRDELGEEHAPDQHDDEIQDMTLCATLAKDPSGKATPVAKPEGYNPDEFDGSTAIISTEKDEKILNHKLHDWESFITYAELPNNKYLLNWPFHSNDFPDTNAVFGTKEERAHALERAKHRTLCYIYYIQNDLGHPEWGIATDEYPTEDNLPMIPYVRESRRVKGLVTMVEEDVLPAPGCVRPPFRADSIAVGDYYLDHHHSKMHLPPGERLEENYPSNAAFQVSWGCMVPESVDGLIAAEKCISVSHIVNGCSRLQPVATLLGQVAGAAAGVCVKKGCEPRALSAEDVQAVLHDEKVMMYVYTDLDHTLPCFTAVQKLALTGMMPAEEPFRFQPKKKITREEAAEWAKRAGIDDSVLGKFADGMTKGDWFVVLHDAKW